MAFVSTLGASDANSLLSVERATALLQDLPPSYGVSAWLTLTDTQKQQTLVAATMAINPLHWKGHPANSTQSLAWPRVIAADHFYQPTDQLPIDFEIGVAYMAAFLGINGGYTGISSLDGGVKRRNNSEYDEIELGRSDLRVKFNRDNTVQTGQLFIPPFSMDIFSRYMIRGGFYQPRVRRESTARINVYGRGLTYRQSRIRIVDGQVWPAYGGWESNPL